MIAAASSLEFEGRATVKELVTFFHKLYTLERERNHGFHSD